LASIASVKLNDEFTPLRVFFDKMDSMTTEQRQVEYDGETFSLAVKFVHTSDNWLVFLHGIGCAKECFDEVFETDLAQKYSILVFDFLGFGDSDKPEDLDYTMQQHAAIGKALIEQFSPDKVSLIAHSMGGTIGVLLAPMLNNLDTFINIEGNLVSEDAGIVSRRTAEQAESDFVQRGFSQFLAQLRNSDERSFKMWALW
jgi:pimeloyl-ACP methyl ester carboxylesterase